MRFNTPTIKEEFTLCRSPHSKVALISPTHYFHRGNFSAAQLIKSFSLRNKGRKFLDFFLRIDFSEWNDSVFAFLTWYTTFKSINKCLFITKAFHESTLFSKQSCHGPATARENNSLGERQLGFPVPYFPTLTNMP